MNTPVEIYPALSAGGLYVNAFIGRVPGIDVVTERETALERLRVCHDYLRDSLGFEGMPLITATQVHGNEVAIVGESTQAPVEGADALITNRPHVCLGIYVADCCAVYAIDPVAGCIGLAHSGKKGTELEILPAMLRKMECAYGSTPGNVIIQLSPCIRPPHYEIDFAAAIVRQGEAMGVAEVVDPGDCTASNPDLYYSYRREKGKTGRMLALLAMLAPRCA